MSLILQIVIPNTRQSSNHSLTSTYLKKNVLQSNEQNNMFVNKRWNISKLRATQNGWILEIRKFLIICFSCSLHWLIYFIVLLLTNAATIKMNESKLKSFALKFMIRSKLIYKINISVEISFDFPIVQQNIMLKSERVFGSPLYFKCYINYYCVRLSSNCN